MGLAASQTRLLSFTARLHSIEAKAEYILGNKKRLSNDTDAVYAKYIQAMDSVTIKSKQINSETGATTWINGSLANLMRYQTSDNTSGDVFYVQNLSSGKLYMPKEICDKYNANIGDMQSFVEQMSMHDYRPVTYDLVGTPSDTVIAKYYEEIFKSIELAGGCIELDSQYVNSASWTTNMIKSAEAILTMFEYDEIAGDGSGYLTKTNAALHTSIREVSDQNAIKIASQEYEASMEDINEKDTLYDKQLHKLESEREALETELDGLKEVMNNNVDVSFKVFL